MDDLVIFFFYFFYAYRVVLHMNKVNIDFKNLMSNTNIWTTSTERDENESIRIFLENYFYFK